MKIAVIIATTGRPQILAQTLTRLARQTRAADTMLVVGASAADFPPASPFGTVQFAISSKGSCKQRNHGIDLVGSTHDIIVFLDDDFVPAKDFIAESERLMSDFPEVVAASGHVLADGTFSAGLTFVQADALIAAYESTNREKPSLVDQIGAYGCNMLIRTKARPEARFDEALPLFGWLEDLDYSSPFARVGRIVLAGQCAGVHLGVKAGRTSGLRLGYSQIANPIYLAAKGTMKRRQATVMMIKNLIANALRCLSPEAYIDRRGRLKGNILALYDLVRGRSHPTRVLTLQPPEPKTAVAQAQL